jgi:oligopeptide transport system substrate-binding protein
MIRTRGVAAATLAVALSLVAASCGGGDSNPGGAAPSGSAAPSAGEPVVGGTLVDLENFASGPQDHIDPAQASVVQGAQIGTLLYDGLTEFDFSNRDNPEIKPNVAQSYTSNSTADEWTFTLKKDVKYSNGDTVKASDFKYAWEQVLNPDLASELSYLLAFIDGAKAVEDGTSKELSGVTADDAAGTLKVKLTAPFADFPGVVSHPVYSPKPKALFSKMATPGDWEKELMIGNGPFKMTKPWTSEDQEVVLERNDTYFGGIEGHKAYLDKIQFKVSKDLDSQYNDFEAGNGQTGYIPSGKYGESTGKYKNATDKSLGLYFFAFNQEDPVVGGDKNLKLRQAIAVGIDRDNINTAVYDGSRRLPSGLTPPGVPGFQAGLCGDLCPEKPNVDRAKKLIDEWKAAGGSFNGPLKIQFNAGAGHEDVVNIMIANLKEIGIEAEPDGRDSKTYFSEMRKGACQFCRAGWIWDYPLYDNGVYAELDSESIDGDNLARLNDPKVDDSIKKARAETDAAKRGALYRDAEKRGLEAVAVVPVNWYAGQVLYKNEVQNVKYTPLQFLLYEDVWLKS